MVSDSNTIWVNDGSMGTDSKVVDQFFYVFEFSYKGAVLYLDRQLVSYIRSRQFYYIMCRKFQRWALNLPIQCSSS